MAAVFDIVLAVKNLLWRVTELHDEKPSIGSRRN